MAIQTYTIAADTDDAEENQSGGNFDAAGTVQCSSHVSASTSRYNGGFVFHNVAIDQGQPVNEAHIKVYFASSFWDDIEASIGAQDVDDAPDFQTSADVTTRVGSITTATVAWSGTNLGAEQVSSPDIAAVIQEVIDREGWESGNSICILLVGGTAASRTTVIESFGTDEGKAAQLEIDVAAGGDGGGGHKRRMLLGIG